MARPRIWSWLRGLPAVLILTSAQIAAADPIDEAREAFRAGASAAKEGHWRDALAHFKRSSALKPHARTTYNLGYCEMMLGRATSAHKLLRRALSEDVDADGSLGDLRMSAEHHLAAVDKQLATLELDIPLGAKVAIDDAPLELESRGPPSVWLAGVRDSGPAEEMRAPSLVRVDPGQRRVVVELPSGVADVRVVDLEVGGHDSIQVRDQRRVLGPQLQGAITLGVSGVALVVVGSVLSGVAAQHWSAAQDACPDAHRCPDASGPDLSAQARVEANIGTAAFASGGAALGGALVLWLTAPSPFKLSIVTGHSTVRARFSW